jgi:hypothetical protein
VVNPGINVGPEPAGTTYGPDMFYSDITVPKAATVVNTPLPRAWAAGGMIESVKRAIVMGLREAFGLSDMDAGTDSGQKFSVSIEYPTKKTDYPGIWVQFVVSSLKRAGLGMETWTKDDNGNWGPIEEWMFEGNITLTSAALSAIDRDRLSDVVMAQLSFARTPDLALRMPQSNANQYRGLYTALDNNPYVAMSLNGDIIQSGGQTVTGGTPWAPNVLLYEDNHSVQCQGQYNMRFNYEGVYELAAIQVVPTISATNVVYNPTQWVGGAPER